MTKKKTTKAEPTMYIARRRRSEAGIGVVEIGDKVDLSPLSPETIAKLVVDGYYAIDGSPSEDVRVAIDNVRGG